MSDRLTELTAHELTGPAHLCRTLIPSDDVVVEIRRRLEALEHSQKIVNIYFSPWGAAKAAMWEELSNDGPFDAEGALGLIRAALDQLDGTLRTAANGRNSVGTGVEPLDVPGGIRA